MNHPVTNLIDSHCHLSDPRIAPLQAKKIIADAKLQGITRLIMGGINPEEWSRQLTLLAKFPNAIVPVFGLHPWWISQATDETVIESAFQQLTQRLREASALGELGLDFTPRFSAEVRKRQQKYFEAQLRLAFDLQKPLVLHVVKAHPQIQEAIDQTYGGSEARGIVHGFSGSWHEAKGYLERGLSISLGGAVTWQTSRPKVYAKLSEVARRLPLEHLLIESDTPDQAPEGLQPSEAHAPVSILRIAEELAQIRGVSAATLLEASADNARRIFGLSK
ncbi:TatD family hydrolase [Bdellovibrionota bacterium FG-2]